MSDGDIWLSSWNKGIKSMGLGIGWDAIIIILVSGLVVKKRPENK